MTLKRCPVRSPGGVTPDGRNPRKGTQCGLEAGHDGDHTVLIPTGYPWAPGAAPPAPDPTPRQRWVRELQTAARTNVECVEHAIVALKLAREYLKEAKAAQTLTRVRLAITSAGGALRNAHARASRRQA